MEPTNSGQAPGDSQPETVAPAAEASQQPTEVSPDLPADHELNGPDRVESDYPGDETVVETEEVTVTEEVEVTPASDDDAQVVDGSEDVVDPVAEPVQNEVDPVTDEV